MGKTNQRGKASFCSVWCLKNWTPVLTCYTETKSNKIQHLKVRLDTELFYWKLLLMASDPPETEENHGRNEKNAFVANL